MRQSLSHPLLNVSHFTYARGGRFLFKDLSFTLGAGEVLVLMGPNGSGKTTLLRYLAGIPASLPAIIKDKSVTQIYVGHLNALKARMTVWENLCYQTRAAPETLTKFLKETKLNPLIDRRIHTLSVGQRRQVALARLPLSQVDLWLVDEPTSHLDEQAATRFWKKLAVHLEKGGAAVVASHTPVPLPGAKVISLHG